jgi:hypothetical protein
MKMKYRFLNFFFPFFFARFTLLRPFTLIDFGLFSDILILYKFKIVFKMKPPLCNSSFSTNNNWSSTFEN